jgi:hypothetical protein
VVALAVWLAGPAASPGWAAGAGGTEEVAILQLKVIEGEGAVHPAGSRSSRPLRIQVTDETGQPVEGAAVSLRMPSEGPRGAFQSGLPTEILVTGPEGRVSAWGIRWGRSPGPVRIRITAVKGDVRAGMVSEQYIAAPGRGGERGSHPKQPSTSKPRGKWIAIALVAAGAAAGGLVLGLSGKSQTAAAPEAPGVQVGAPTITIGKP